MKVVFDRRATAEFTAAVQWIENQQYGLGMEFDNEVQQVLDSIEIDPFQFTPVPGSRHQDQFRVGLVSRFRYVIIFEVVLELDSILILSVEHGHRRPGNWRRRSKNFEP